VLVCQGARIAVPGIYPYIFPDRGYRGQLDWLCDTAAYKAPIADQAYVTLLAVAKEGAIVLPQHVTVELATGQTVYLGPHLTTPKPGPLAKRTTLTMTVTREGATIEHFATKVADGAESEDLPNLVEDCETDDEERAEDEEVVVEEVPDEEGNSELTKEGQEKKLQERDEQEQECQEKHQDDKDRRAEEQQSRADSQRAFQKADDLEAKKIHVTFGDKDVSEFDLKEHFEQFGNVEEVFLPTPRQDFAMVTFRSGAVAQWLAGMERHTLQRSSARGGPLPIQLRGCGPGWAARLPGGSGRGGARRRAPVLQQNATNPLRCMEHRFIVTHDIPGIRTP
jgi:hypothetical protein